ncbi:MAG: response regulator transcription factor [Planctomycetes bacterium]|nr:response regulator transcription factor [Planctomycetota bacterium]
MSSEPDSILLVEDDVRVRHELRSALADAGFAVREAADLAQARDADATRHSLVLLDLGLPDGDGLDFCRALREQGAATPIIALTARDASKDRIRGLDAGADDYVVKPFEVGEVLARIRSVLRRSRREVTQQVYRCGDLWADAESREAGRGERRIEFAPREFDLLLFLLKNPGKAWTRDQLLEHVWGVRGGVGDSRTIDLHVRKLRRKIEDNPAAARIIATVWGIGYRLNDEEQAP